MNIFRAVIADIADKIKVYGFVALCMISSVSFIFYINYEQRKAIGSVNNVVEVWSNNGVKIKTYSVGVIKKTHEPVKVSGGVIIITESK